MDETKRRPGRPRGSGIDDSVPLMAMARLISDHPGLLAKTAARRVFRASGQISSKEDAWIHRWQGKWKVVGASCLQRVQDERAEAERQRRGRETARVRQNAPAWGVVAGSPAAIAMIDSMMHRSAAWDAMMRPSREMLAAANAMPRMGLSRADLDASPALAGFTASEAVRKSLELSNASGIGAAMRKYDTIGRALDAACVARISKLPNGL